MEQEIAAATDMQRNMSDPCGDGDQSALRDTPPNSPQSGTPDRGNTSSDSQESESSISPAMHVVYEDKSSDSYDSSRPLEINSSNIEVHKLVSVSPFQTTLAA